MGSHRMPVRRLVVAHAVVLAILGGSLFDIVTGDEHWPFSPYEMFSHRARQRVYMRRRFFGVVDEPEGREIHLRYREYLAPFDLSRMGVVLERLDMRRNGRERNLQAACKDALRRYENLRKAGHHDGPPLKEVRLYRTSWRLDPAVRNLDRPERVLVASSKPVPAGDAQ